MSLLCESNLEFFKIEGQKIDTFDFFVISSLLTGDKVVLEVDYLEISKYASLKNKYSNIVLDNFVFIFKRLNCLSYDLFCSILTEHKCLQNDREFISQYIVYNFPRKYSYSDINLSLENNKKVMPSDLMNDKDFVIKLCNLCDNIAVYLHDKTNLFKDNQFIYKISESNSFFRRFLEFYAEKGIELDNIRKQHKFIFSNKSHNYSFQSYQLSQQGSSCYRR